MTKAQRLAEDLNEYMAATPMQEQDPWNEIIYPRYDVDMDATEAADASNMGEIVILTDGSAAGYDEPAREWREIERPTIYTLVYWPAAGHGADITPVAPGLAFLDTAPDGWSAVCTSLDQAREIVRTRLGRQALAAQDTTGWAGARYESEMRTLGARAMDAQCWAGSYDEEQDAEYGSRIVEQYHASADEGCGEYVIYLR